MNPAADPTGAGLPAERPGDLRHLASEIERIRGRAMLTRVVREADLLYDPAFNPALAREIAPQIDAEPEAAAERFFGQPPADLFETVCTRIKLPGRPARKRPRPGKLPRLYVVETQRAD